MLKNKLSPLHAPVAMELLNLRNGTINQLETRGFLFRGRISIFLNEFLQPEGEVPLELTWETMRQVVDTLSMESTPRNLRVNIFTALINFIPKGALIHPLNSNGPISILTYV